MKKYNTKLIAVFVAVLFGTIGLLGGYNTGYDNGYDACIVEGYASYTQCFSDFEEILADRFEIYTDFEGKPINIIPTREYVEYDSNMAFESFLTTVTDNQGLSRFDFDIELPFDKTESGDVIVKVHINKGDILEEK